MTQQEFFALCANYNIFPPLALESSENLIQALRDKDDEKVREILENEF